MDTLAFLDQLQQSSIYEYQIVHTEHIRPRKATFAPLESSLDTSLQTALEAFDLLPLFSHQASAINAAISGKNVAVSTPSASGKTLCYNVPVIQSLLKHKHGRALYLFPTKALAQDQLRTLYALTDAIHPGIQSSTFDGDTPQKDRAQIRRMSRVILSNPDMLHVGILPNHRSWTAFLSQLRYVVVDEAHVYRGIFGSHVANILRRLRRLCARYGAQPQFICCSATIANPGEHAEMLTGLPFETVTEDGAPFGGKDFICWNPPLIDAARSIRRSASGETTNLLIALIQAGIRSLAFARTRRLVELIYIYVHRHLEQLSPELADLIKPYRAGYLAEDRRAIEKDLFKGNLLATVATNALELGVDIGRLDATILTGYPGSIASTFQQAGRSGRRGKRSLSILVGSENPLDQYFMRHPEHLFGSEFEHALISPSNSHVMKPHLLCAAWEFPLTDADCRYFTDFDKIRMELVNEGLLRAKGKRWYPVASITYPAQNISIRSGSSINYTLVDTDTGQVLETIESETAFFQIHPGAIYLHQGDAYLVTELDLVTHVAYAQSTKAHYYTQSKDITDLDIISTQAQKRIGELNICLGEVEVTTTVIGFKKKRVYTEEILGEEPLDLPPQSFKTVARSTKWTTPRRIQRGRVESLPRPYSAASTPA